MKYLPIILILSCSTSFSQNAKDSLKYAQSDPVFYANTLSTHPFGVFISRINSDFQLNAAKKLTLSFTISSGNVWLPFVKAYSPINEIDRNAMRKLIWHMREGNYDAIHTPALTSEFEADGIIRLYQFKINVPVKTNQNFKISFRMFSLDRGIMPYSTLTSDRFIEWFHSHISGGEDPFARKVYGYNHAKISYTDEFGKSFQVNDGDILFTGIDLSYFYFPAFKKLEKLNFYTNIGMQLGINVSSVNQSLDIGVNPSVIKKFNINGRNKIHLGASLGALSQKVIQRDDNPQLSNKKILLGYEFLLDYILYFSKKNYISLATTYYIQNSYNKKDEFKYMVLTGQRISTHWNYAISHLYRTITGNTFIISWSKGTLAFSVYFREDLWVDNAPDLQTGVGVQMCFK